MVKNTPFSATDPGSFPVWGRSLGGRHGKPLQYSCLRIPWTEEPGVLHSKGSQRVRHYWTTAVYFIVFLFYAFYVLLFALVPKSCLTLLQPHRLWPSRLFCPWDFPGKNTGVGCHSLLWGIFLTQGLNPDLLHCRWILYCLSHHGSPKSTIFQYKMKKNFN